MINVIVYVVHVKSGLVLLVVVFFLGAVCGPTHFNNYSVCVLYICVCAVVVVLVVYECDNNMGVKCYLHLSLIVSVLR